MRLIVKYEKLREFREKHRWSGHELSAETRRVFGKQGVSSTHIYALERGEKDATMEVTGVLCYVLGCTRDDISTTEVLEDGSDSGDVPARH